MGERVDLGGLGVARDDDRPSAMCDQIARHRIDPSLVWRRSRAERRRDPARQRREPHGVPKRGRERADVARADAQAMIRGRARHAVERLDHVEPVHRVGRREHGPARGELARQTEAVGPSRQEIGVERHDDVGAIEREPRLEDASERDPRALPGVVHPGRSVELDACAREALADPVEHPRDRG